MSSIMRWRNGLMGLSVIAKAPVSHGVEPHDLETGPDLRVPLQPMACSPGRSPPPLPRERFSPRAHGGPRALILRRRNRTSGVSQPMPPGAGLQKFGGGGEPTSPFGSPNP